MLDLQKPSTVGEMLEQYIAQSNKPVVNFFEDLLLGMQGFSCDGDDAELNNHENAPPFCSSCDADEPCVHSAMHGDQCDQQQQDGTSARPRYSRCIFREFCASGTACAFLHSPEEMAYFDSNPTERLFALKTRPCPLEFCPNAHKTTNCKFAHGRTFCTQCGTVGNHFSSRCFKGALFARALFTHQQAQTAAWRPYMRVVRVKNTDVKNTGNS